MSQLWRSSGKYSHTGTNLAPMSPPFRVSAAFSRSVMAFQFSHGQYSRAKIRQKTPISCPVRTAFPERREASSITADTTGAARISPEAPTSISSGSSSTRRLAIWQIAFTGFSGVRSVVEYKKPVLRSSPFSPSSALSLTG